MANIFQYLSIVCAELQWFHAFTGSDYSASFTRKRKVRPFDVMITNEKFLGTFIRLGQSDIVFSELSATLEWYFCAVYGQSNSSDVNSAGYKIFCQNVCSTYWWQTMGENKIRWPMLFATLQSHTAAEDWALQSRSSVLEKFNNGQTAWCLTSWTWMGTWWQNFECSLLWGTTYTITAKLWVFSGMRDQIHHHIFEVSY